MATAVLERPNIFGTIGAAFARPPKPEKIPKGIPHKRVYICSPLAGSIERNMKRAEIYCRFAFDKGFVPIAPHIYFPRFLSDDDKNERAAGQRYGLEMMWQCKELWAFGLRITDGMRAEIELAKQLKIPIRYFYDDMEEIKE
jgi:hypothetical protein